MLSLFRTSDSRTKRGVDGGDVLDRMATRMRRPINGDFRVMLASELEQAVSTVGACPSHMAACVAASREAHRIAQKLRISAPAFTNMLAEELSQAGAPR
jgi:hypothetical protein